MTHYDAEREARERMSCPDCQRRDQRALDALKAQHEAAQREIEWLRAKILLAIPKCSTDATDFQMAKMEAAAWRLLAREVYSLLLEFRSQVLRYTVPPDSRFIATLNLIDRLIRDHDAALATPPAPRGNS